MNKKRDKGFPCFKTLYGLIKPKLEIGNKEKELHSLTNPNYWLPNPRHTSNLNRKLHTTLA